MYSTFEYKAQNAWKVLVEYVTLPDNFRFYVLMLQQFFSLLLYFIIVINFLRVQTKRFTFM